MQDGRAMSLRLFSISAAPTFANTTVPGGRTAARSRCAISLETVCCGSIRYRSFPATPMSPTLKNGTSSVVTPCSTSGNPAPAWSFPIRLSGCTCQCAGMSPRPGIPEALSVGYGGNRRSSGSSRFWTISVILFNALEVTPTSAKARPSPTPERTPHGSLRPRAPARGM